TTSYEQRDMSSGLYSNAAAAAAARPRRFSLAMTTQIAEALRRGTMRKSLLATVALLASAASAASPLADLIQDGGSAAALELIEQGADVNAAQGDGTTPLQWAVYRLDTDLARQLLERGANANVQNRYGASPLAEAVKAANVELVEMLLAEIGRAAR